jgi:mRNA-degrading endonuclease toxin of MazEF toxin-antitoxin module
MSYRSGDIVHINFPMAEGDSALGLPRFKARPALVVTDADGSGDFTVVAVTSQGHHGPSVELKSADLSNGRLSQTSWVRADKIYTVNAQAVQQRMAMAKPEFLARVRKALCPAVGCK